MRLSFDWLSDYVDLTGVTPAEVAEKLTMGAFEVEEVRKFGPDIEGPLVIGEILEINPHPNADKIRLTKTRIAKGEEPLEIVCGAANIAVGQRVPVALPGAKVINRKDGTALAIKTSSIRGVQSNGMLCSPPELGLVEPGSEVPEASGILILDQSIGEIGSDIRRLFHLYPDFVLIVEPRSNRGDALSVIGLAREVAALLKRPLKRPDWSLSLAPSAEIQFKVSTENETDCPFFSVRVINNLKIGPSPAAIARRLEAVGVRPVNNVVDVTNYVMHEYGQPLHAYDLASLKTSALSVRRANQGERLTTLDGRERTLTNDVMVIANAAESVGIAGVMGGENSEISDTTVSVALEAACFNAARVRRACRLLGLSSESSLRFERGVDVATVAEASARATYLLIKHCTHVDKDSAQVSALFSAGSDKIESGSIAFRLPQLKRYLAQEFSPQQVGELLSPLGFSVSENSEQELSVKVPSFRAGDVSREIDLVEEVCRIWGYDKLKATMPRSTVSAHPPDDTVGRTRATLAASGLSEAWLSSLTATDGQSDYASQQESKLVRVLNPLSDDHQVLRQSLIPGLVKVAAYNHDRGRKDVWMFELGRTYNRLSDGVADRWGTGVIEEMHVAGLIMGENELSHWQKNESKTDFYRAKGIVENLLRVLNVDLERVRFFSGQANKMLHPARSCQIAFDRGQQKPASNNHDNNPKHQIEIIGMIGQLHPGFSDSVGLSQPPCVFELNLEVLTKLGRPSSFDEIASAPAVIRDLTVDVNNQIDHAAISSCIRASAGKALADLDLVSIYAQSGGERSLSYRLSFQDKQRTLTNEEVDTSLVKVRESLMNRLGASFRA